MSKKPILVTGWLGYIWANIVYELCKKWIYEVFIVDDMSNSTPDKIKELESLGISFSFIQDDFCSLSIRDVIKNNNIETVIHCAGKKDVEESFTEVSSYFETNVTKLMTFVMMCEELKVTRFIFSSSAAVYWDANEKVNELSAIKPKSPYAYTKFIWERLLSYSLLKNTICLRYFNPIGSLSGNILSDKTNSVFNIFRNIEEVTICWRNYQTKDWTPVRDFIDIRDLVAAHIFALHIDGKEIFNVWRGEGVTVKELAEAMWKKIIYWKEREWDIAYSVADTSKINSLWFKTKFTLSDTISNVECSNSI